MERFKHHFLGTDKITHLYSGAESPMLKTSIDFYSQYLMDKSLGDPGRTHLYKMEEELKTNLGKLINAAPQEIAFSGNASEGINKIINALEIKAGDNVVLNDLEYASVYLPWIKLGNELDVEIRLISSENGRIDPEKIKSNIDHRTCLVAVSHVSYLNGFKHDLKMLRKITIEKKVPLLVDTTQSLGVMSVDSEYFDFMVASTYKWLLGTHGLGVIYISKEYLSKLSVSHIGWRSVQSIFENDRFSTFKLKEDASKFEAGFNNYPGIYILKNSTDFLLEVGITEIEKHVIQLGNELIEKLEKLNLEVTSSPYEAERSGNITFSANSGEEIMNELEEQKIKVWGGDGRVRISLHLFNDLNDIENLVNGLIKLRKKSVL